MKDNGKFLNQIGVQSLRRLRWRRVDRGGERGGWETAMVAADPTSVEEKNDYEKENGEEYYDDEQCSASDLEISVI